MILACQKNFISFLLQFVQGWAHICYRLPGLIPSENKNKFTDLDYHNTGNRRSRYKCQQNYARV